jgi:hypothetical protein
MLSAASIDFPGPSGSSQCHQMFCFYLASPPSIDRRSPEASRP